MGHVLIDIEIQEVAVLCLGKINSGTLLCPDDP